jgi:hypothetical protein
MCRMGLDITSVASLRIECRPARVRAQSEVRQGFPDPVRMIYGRIAVPASPAPFASSPFPCGAFQMCLCSLPCSSFFGCSSVAKHGADVHQVNVNIAESIADARRLRVVNSSAAFTGTGCPGSLHYGNNAGPPIDCRCLRRWAEAWPDITRLAWHRQRQHLARSGMSSGSADV